MNLRTMLLASMAVAFVAVGTGCSNKADAERQSLINQNKDLTQQLDAEKAAHAQADARANAATAQVATTPPEAVTPPPMDGGPLDLTPGPSGRGPRTSASSGITGVTSSTNSRGETVLEISGDVLFDSGKATLKPAAKKTLDGVATALKSKYGGQQVRVEGHTDPTPVKSSGWDDNYDLGFVRARAVMKYLVEKGVPEKDMYPASFGAMGLKSTKNLALDRRVDIVVVKNGK